MNEISKPVHAWLTVVCLMTLAMISLGGITRLTQSGLSMVTWEPLMGAIPPLNEAQWDARFAQYKQFPEYQQVNRDMTLPEFKRIFLWEYLHRLVGRLIGIVFFVPFIVFWARRKLSRPLVARLFLALVLGGLQGVLGWYMVRSGLVDDPRVSHFRLTAHLGLALALLSYLYWIRMGHPPAVFSGNGLAFAFCGLLFVQIVYGAFTAGLDAGYFYNTFPKMNGMWIPVDAFHGWPSLISDPVTVQFLHRWLGILVGLAAVALWLKSRRGPVHAILGLTLLQVVLGIGTLVMHMPVWMAALHQLNAALLLLAAVAAIHTREMAVN